MFFTRIPPLQSIFSEGQAYDLKFCLTFCPIIIIMNKLFEKRNITGCSAAGSALGSGPRGREFKSPHSDHEMR